MVTTPPIFYLVPVLVKSLQVSETFTPFALTFPNIAILVIVFLFYSIAIISNNFGLKGGNLNVTLSEFLLINIGFLGT